MKLILTDNYRLPNGKPLADLMQAVFAMQQREALRWVRTAKQIVPVNMDGWQEYMEEKVLPYYVQYVAMGWKLNAKRLQSLIPGYKPHAKSAATDRKAKEDREEKERIALLLLLGMMSPGIVYDIRWQVRGMVSAILGTTGKWLAQAVAAYQASVTSGVDPLSARLRLAENVRQVFTVKRRPMLIGEDESSRAFHFGMIRVLQESKYQWMKEWHIHDEEACPVCKPLDGVIIPMDQTFASQAATGTYKDVYSLVNHPPAHPSCRCRLSTFIDVDPAEYRWERQRMGAAI